MQSCVNIWLAKSQQKFEWCYYYANKDSELSTFPVMDDDIS